MIAKTLSDHSINFDLEVQKLLSEQTGVFDVVWIIDYLITPHLNVGLHLVDNQLEGRRFVAFKNLMQ